MQFNHIDLKYFLSDEYFDFSEVRKKIGLTQTQLADILFLTLRTVQNYEKNNNTPKYIRKLIWYEFFSQEVQKTDEEVYANSVIIDPNDRATYYLTGKVEQLAIEIGRLRSEIKYLTDENFSLKNKLNEIVNKKKYISNTDQKTVAEPRIKGKNK